MSVEVAGVALEAQAPAAAMAALLPQGLLACVEENNVAGLLVLLESCSSVDERNEIGQTVLMLAAEQGSLEIVQELLKRGANCNLEDDDSWTALISASKEGHLDIVRELIQNNADIEHREMGGWTALMWAAYKGRTDVARLLLDHKANPNVAGQFSMYPVTWAAGRGHNEIVNMLLNAGSKSNCCDKYGTTPLIWAARKGHLESVQLLLQHSADVNQVGANSMTALIAAVRGGFESVVEELLTKEPDVNLTDKDGNSALMIAAKEGKTEIARDLLDAGAYVNTPDRHGDTVLIWAVKGGHPDIVRALVGKLADVDVRGAENKTALYWAVEKGNSTIVCDILECNPDTEIHTKDGDTPLIKATKMRNVDIVQLLLNKNAKVSAADKNGDTSLHIAIRGRSRKLAELLLRNPKDGRLLYRPNKAGETPYNIDCGHHKSILTQIFGARHLSPNEADGDMLGYDLYSSALADILSEPTMQPPICVGLYAQWGSGKSFLLKKLEDEMKTFAGQEIEPLLRFSWLLVMLTLAFASVLGLVLAVTVDPNLGLAVAFSLLALFYIFLVVVYFGGQQEREGWTWAWLASTWLARQLCYVELLLQLVFTNPPELPEQTTRALPVRFLFTDYSRLTSVGGETSIAEMVATLCDACEREFGFLVTRLYRVFRTENTQGKKGVGRWKKSCCLPSVLLMALVLGCVVALVVLLAAVEAHTDVRLRGALIAVSSVVAMALVAKAPMAWQVLVSLLRSQRQRLLAAAASSHNKLKMEGFMKVLKSEVDLMAKMTKTLDSFTQYQTRLVVIVDGLDTCEQDRVLQMLDTVRILFSQAPFISIFASDPHIIIKAINQNLNSVLRDSNINGHDYMRNVVHLPFFLNNRGPPIARRLAVAAGPAAANGDVPGHEATVAWFDDGEQKPSQHSLGELTKIGSKVSLTRRETLKRRQMARQLTRQMSFDLSKLLVTEDWFSDINPQTMRRLLNVVSLTGRLLRANQVQFNWDRLATWINMTEQWPYRTSWVVLYLEEVEGVGDHLTLKMVYDRFSSKIPQSKDVEPLLEIDGDARSFEVFLTSRTPTLTVCDVRTFMACTVNLDPKIREIIADVHAAQVGATSASVFPSATAAAPAPGVPHSASGVSASGRSSGPSGAGTPAPFAGGGGLATQPSSCSYFDGGMGPQHPFYNRPYFAPQLYLPSAATRPPTELCLAAAAAARPAMSRDHTNLPSSAALLGDATSPTLSSLPVADVCERLATLEGIDHGLLDKYQDTIRKANINGRVLAQCNMDELKDEMSMNFGDWQLFRSMVLEMRELEKQPSHDLRSAGESGGVGVSALDGGPPPHRERATVTASASVGAAAKPDAALPNDKYSLNFSFEELCTVGLDEPALGGQASLWQGAGRLADGLSHRTHSMSSLNSEASVAELSRLAERQQAEYRDAYGAYISQMAQVDCPTSGASSIKSSQVTSPHSPVHFLLGGSVSSVSLHEENRNHNACSQRVAAYGGGGATGGGCGGGGAGGGGGGQPFSLSASLSSSSSLPPSKAASSHSADASDSSAAPECAAAAAVPALDPITEEEDHAGDPAGGRARPAAAAAAASATAAAAATLGKRVLQAVDIKHRSYQQLASDDDNSGADESDDVPLLRSAAAADSAAPALERWGPAAAADPDADRPAAAQPSDDANTNANNSGGKAGGPAAKSDGYVAEMIPLGKKDSSDSGARVADCSPGPCGFAGPPAARAVGDLVEFAGAELAPAAVDAGPLLLLPMPATATAGGGGAPDAPDVTRMSICSDGKRSPSGSESSLILSSPEAERRALVPPVAQAETGRRRKAEPAAVVGGGVLNRVDSVETINNNNRSSLGTGGGGGGVLPSTATAPRSAATPMTPPKKQTARSKMGSIGGGGGTGAAGRSAGGPAPSSPNVRVPLRGGGGGGGAGGGNAAKANTARARVDNARPNLNRKAPAPTRGKKGGGSSGSSGAGGGGAGGAADSAGASAEKESIL
ncbi:kinase D-interacting substrate of 220 kDa isoform X2 [Lethenteron reissneri]|uniref:kinase D-interacting substrate of 220 kDa isoform X2 n=1 Tax=Lethenteron reissneri TaxID=7753 RepID=UPI002AB65836|nr:kinase D-interacting substrate of 220 kDa isoform X2 [Lethenteron reissneri]